MVQDTSSTKEKILSAIRRRGPSLPVQIANDVQISSLFASAFLSELVSEKAIKISSMKVGNSPLYFVPRDESKLENFFHHLKSKEREAFEKLRNKKFLIDSEQEPAIRIALRQLRDFAMPFKKDEKIIWRYFLVPESEFTLIKKAENSIQKNESKEEIKENKTEEKELNIFDKKAEKQKKSSTKRRTSKKSNSGNDKFFNVVKNYLLSKSIDILSIEGFTKNELWLKINDSEKEKLLYAFNKKRPTEADILKAAKKASELDLPYILLSKGEPLKKVTNLLNAIKSLSSIETL